MIDGLRPYPAYKDAGVPWLGEVPGHWEVPRLRDAVDMRVSNVDKHTKEGELRVRLCNYVNVYKNERITDRVSFMGATATSEEIARFRLERDDVLITKDSESWNDIGVPALVEHSAPDLVCGYHLALLRPFRELMNGSYLLRAMQSPGVSYQFRVEANGVTRYGLSHAAIKSISLPLPPLPEQAAIVRFLDHADRRIRRYIGAKQKLIKLLEEQKQAIIQRAVTRGLNPHVGLKPSGVEWLGDVPDHWSLKRFKFLARVASGQVDPRKPEHRGKTLVAPNHIKSGTGKITYHETAEEQGADSGKYEVRQGQIIYSKIRPNLRKAAIASVDCLCSADMYPIAVRQTDLRPAYLLLLLLSAPFTKYAVDCSLRVAMPKVNRDALGECLFWYPSLKEQDAILQVVEHATEPGDLVVAQAGREVALLREYRTRLIADVVTGKLDVREAAAQLPDEAEEPEPLAEADALTDGEEEGVDDLDAVPEEAEA
ncbi:MAG: restriction endonuclease subunit S [Gammaproteobacteria bacterium]